MKSFRQVYFIKKIIYFLLLSLMSAKISEALGLNGDQHLQKIANKARELKHEIENALQSHNKTCNSMINLDDEYRKIIADFLRENNTGLAVQRVVNNTHEMHQASSVNASNKTESFFDKVKEGISSIFHHNHNTSDDRRIRRCLTREKFEEETGLDLAEITIDSEVVNITSSDMEKLRKFLSHLDDCFRNWKDGEDNGREGMNGDAGKKDVLQSKFLEKDFPLSSPDIPYKNSKIDSLLRYLTQAQHPVQDVGRPIHKSPDLQKVQQIVDEIKSFDFFDLDGAETTEKENEFSDPMIGGDFKKRSSRNIFDDLSKKVGELFDGSKSSSKHTQDMKSSADTKQKRKSSGLFSNIDIDRVHEKKLETESIWGDKKPAMDRFNPSSESEQKEIPAQEPSISQPSEAEKLVSDLNRFETRLSPEQHAEISNFLDQINERPKNFKFDTSPYLQAAIEKLNHPELDQDNQQEEVLDGAKKFFDFDTSPVKRSLYGSGAEDFQKIAKLKSKLIAEYREHHPILDYSEILRKVEAQVEAVNSRKSDDDFIEKFYHLNDGSSSLGDVLKPYRPDTHVMSPFELNLSFKLDDEFKELDSKDLDRQKTDADEPLYKPEMHLITEVEEFSP